MSRLMRRVGYALIAVGGLVLVFWLVEPLRVVWPWFWALPLPIRIGLGIALIGFIVLMTSLIGDAARNRVDLDEDRRG